MVPYAAESKWKIETSTQAYMTSWRPDCTCSFWRRYYPPSHSLCLIQGKRSTAESKTNAFLNEAYHPLRATSCASFTIASCFDWGGLIFYFVDKYVKILSGKGGTKILISPIDKTTSSRLLPYLSDCISTEQTEKP